MSITILLLTLEVLGAFIAIYLISKRKKQQHPICVIGEDCQVVLESKYNSVFGIVHNDVMGLLYYLLMIGLVILLRFEIGPGAWLLLSLQLLAGVGAFMAVIFMYVQWKVLKAWCFWCIISNTNTWIIALIVFKYL